MPQRCPDRGGSMIESGTPAAPQPWTRPDGCADACEARRCRQPAGGWASAIGFAQDPRRSRATVLRLNRTSEPERGKSTMDHSFVARRKHRRCHGDERSASADGPSNRNRTRRALTAIEKSAPTTKPRGRARQTVRVHVRAPALETPGHVAQVQQLEEVRAVDQGMRCQMRNGLVEAERLNLAAGHSERARRLPECTTRQP